MAFLATVRLKSVVPEPVTVVGLKLVVTPVGAPVSVKLTAESNPPEAVTVTTAYPLCPCNRYPEEGETDRVKLPLFGAVTVSETVVVSTVEPEVPVTVIG